MSSPNWFIGLPVAAGDWFARLPPPPPGVRMFAPGDLHITVAFLGPVQRRAAERAFDVAGRWSLGVTEAVLGAVVPMGRARRPSAFSALLEEPQPVAQAIAQVRAGMCEAAGCRKDERPPKPHVTLARPRRRASDAERVRAQQWASALELGQPTVRLDRLALYTWSTQRARALFERVATRCLEDLPAPDAWNL